MLPVLSAQTTRLVPTRDARAAPGQPSSSSTPLGQHLHRVGFSWHPHPAPKGAHAVQRASCWQMWKGGGKYQGLEAVGLPGEPLLVWLLSLWRGGGCASPRAAVPFLCPLQRGELQGTQREVLGSQ